MLTALEKHKRQILTALSEQKQEILNLNLNVSQLRSELDTLKSSLAEEADSSSEDDESSAASSDDGDSVGCPLAWSAWPLFIDASSADLFDPTMCASMAHLPVLKTLLRVPGAMVKANMGIDKHSHLPAGTIAKVYGGDKKPTPAVILNSQVLIEFLENLSEAVQPEVQVAVFLARFGQIVGKNGTQDICPEDNTTFHFTETYALVPSDGAFRVTLYTDQDNMAVASINVKPKPTVFTGGMVKTKKMLSTLTEEESNKLSGNFTLTAMTIPQELKDPHSDAYDERVEPSLALGTVKKPVIRCQSLRLISQLGRDDTAIQCSELPKDGTTKLIVTVTDSSGDAVDMKLSSLLKCLNAIGCELTASAKKKLDDEE